MAGPGIPHHAHSDDHRRIGIFISVLAVLMAIVTALAKAEANKMIVKEVQASNSYAWYQSKRQRSYMNELEIHRINFELAGSISEAQREVLERTRAKLTAKNDEYETENKDIQARAESEKKLAESASHRHHWFEYSEILLHIAVVLSSLTLLTEQKLFFKLGLGATVGGIVLAVFAWFVH